MNSKAWLQELKAGDKVFYQGGFHVDVEAVKVERVTPTLVIVNGHKFRRADGYTAGPYVRYRHSGRPHLLAFSEEEWLKLLNNRRDKSAIRMAKQKLSDYYLTPEQARAILAVLDLGMADAGNEVIP